MASLDEYFYRTSVGQYIWSKKPLLSRLELCAECGNSLQFDLQELKYDEAIRRVRSGYSPNGPERAVYSKLLDDAQKDMDRCQSELCRLQSLSRELEAQRDLLRVYVASVGSMISPIQKLPLELLGEIFKYICCGDTGINYIISKAEKQLPTLAVSGVCIRWYTLVTSIPALWSSFGSKALDNPSTPSLFKVFLERSRLHPVDFKIDNLSFGSPKHSFSFLTATENSSRWRHVQIAAQESFMVDNILIPLIDGKQHLPALVSLDLRSLFEGDSESPSFSLDCPALQSLTLNGLPFELRYPRPAITYLNLECVFPNEISRVILHCPNVQVLEVKHIVDNLEDAPTTTCNTLKFIMEYGNTDPAGPPRLFDCINFPKLAHLVLSGPESQCETYHIVSLCSMLERGPSRLTHLSIHFIPLTSDELLRLFLCVPLVTTLEVEEPQELHTDGPDIPLVLKSLVAPSSSDDKGDHSSDDKGDHGGKAEVGADNDEEVATNGRCLLPHLKDLRLVIRPCTMMLLRLVRSRWRPSLLTMDDSSGIRDTIANEVCVCLQRISIRCLGEVGEGMLKDLQECLKEFKEDGMSVEVSLS